MSRNDHHPSAGRIAQEAILAGRIARRSPACPDCGAPTDVYRLDKLFRATGRTCTGYACTARCGWEGTPRATLNAAGVMVRASADGHPTSEVCA